MLHELTHQLLHELLHKLAHALKHELPHGLLHEVAARVNCYVHKMGKIRGTGALPPQYALLFTALEQKARQWHLRITELNIDVPPTVPTSIEDIEDEGRLLKVHWWKGRPVP